MNAALDTTKLRGGPIQRYGGKGTNAQKIVPHFAHATTYVEACMGAGSVFFRVPAAAYQRRAVNDIDDRLVTFFRVLRDRPEDLVRACSLTPYSLTEFTAALARSEDPLEEARRVWVLGRQAFAGIARTPGNWGRTLSHDTAAGGWGPSGATTKLDSLHLYARSMLNVAIDCIDGAAFIEKWGRKGAMVYVDPPYLPELMACGGGYRHDASTEDHHRFAAACRGAVERGARVCVSGYASDLYNDIYAGWRRVDFDVPLKSARHTRGQRRTESLWMSYPASEEIGAGPLSLTEGT